MKSGNGIPAFYVDYTGTLCLQFPLNDLLNGGGCWLTDQKVQIKTWHNLVVSSVESKLDIKQHFCN